MIPAMDYVGRIFRPPSEARSLLLQITVGCSHNRCAYCDMYRDKRFRPKDMAQIEADIEEAAAAGPQFHRMFLCDGDASPSQRNMRWNCGPAAAASSMSASICAMSFGRKRLSRYMSQ